MKNNEEIDLVELTKLLWRRRMVIIRVTVATGIVAIAIALISPVRYTARAIILPQADRNLSNANIQGLAAIAGLNLNPDTQGDLLPPAVYPMVVGSIPFQKELIRSAGLMAAERDTIPAGEILTLSPDENRWRNRLSKILSVRVDSKNGTVTLAATMPTAREAAMLAARAQDLLEQYITRFKVQKAQDDLDFVEARFREVKADFEARQRTLAAFQDANRRLVSEVARTRENTLRSEYDLAFAIYSELARQREQARIKVKEQTPVFTVVEPVSVPFLRSAPRRALIVAIGLLVGFLVGAVVALMLPHRDR
jgi:LPS O-antigen subunit length determinant protein (WzzB/FepE family)